MSTGLDGGAGGREFYLSAHRCPEVDLLSYHNYETKILPPCTLVPAEKSSESEANYLDISSTCRSEEEKGEEEKKEEEEGEGSISDWSEEDLSLHFSPSVILPSDSEESDPESGYECVDITVESLVKGQEWEGLKMVPKRQIQLMKKKVDQENIEKLQVILKDGPAERRGANSEVSANELLCPTVCHRPDLLLRQHSMPSAFHTHSTTSGDVNSYRVYRGLVAGASQGFHVGGNSRQRLQKSFSLDETKTKMASCIIKNVLSKKMQGEQNNSETSYQQTKPAVLPGFPQPTDQPRAREGGGGETSSPVGKTGGGVFKAPVHVVRDMRRLVKNTYSLSFSTAPATENNNKPTSFKVIGQDDSPPPTYQQAVGVKGHDEAKRSYQASVYNSYCRGHAPKAATSLSQSQSGKQNDRFSCPITQQRRGSEPIMSRSKVDDVTWPVMLSDPPTNSPVRSGLSELSQSEKVRVVSHQAGTSLPFSVFIRPPLHASSTPRHGSAQEHSSILGVSSQFAPSCSQQILHSCFYTTTGPPPPLPTVHPHMGKVGYVHSHPVCYIQTQLQSSEPAPTLLRLSKSVENQPDYFIKTYPPLWTRSTGDQESDGNTVAPATQEQHEHQKLQQQQFLCSVQGFLPAQVGSDFPVDITASVAAPGARLSGPASCHMTLDPKSGRCFYVDTLPQPQRKMLLDPETGQYVHVFHPAASSTPKTVMFPLRCVNPAPIMISHGSSAINSTPTILSVMRFQPTGAVSSLYGFPCLPFTLHTPSVNLTNTAP